MLAVYTEITNTVGATMLQVAALALIWTGKMPAEVYRDFAIGIGYVWMFGSALVLVEDEFVGGDAESDGEASD